MVEKGPEQEETAETDGQTWERRDRGITQNDIYSLAELYEGIFNSTDPAGNEHALQDFLSGAVEVVPVDEETCRIFGRERGRLRSAGRMIADFGLLIGSTCLSHNLTLLSNNRRHFEVVEDLEIISISP